MHYKIKTKIDGSWTLREIEDSSMSCITTDGQTLPFVVDQTQLGPFGNEVRIPWCESNMAYDTRPLILFVTIVL